MISGFSSEVVENRALLCYNNAKERISQILCSLNWYGHVQSTAEGRLPKIALTEETLDGRYKEGHERKKPK